MIEITVGLRIVKRSRSSDSTKTASLHFCKNVVSV